ncbi:hypothetical protein [Ammoniphilus sp. 3BR4]|uniref:hypothetical protein n=1 Tax=Ammoniphilus sp. 3BR4 TaxID=3158265 RepID=UPI00346712CC
MDDLYKKPYRSPTILGHFAITFETIISSTDLSTPPDGNKPIPSPEEQEDSPTGKGKSPKGDSVPNTGPSPKEDPLLKEPLSENNPSRVESGEGLSGNDENTSANNDISSHESFKKAHEESVSQSIAAGTEIQATAGQSYYDLPNTGTSWYIWGMEGAIITSLSGLALWLRQREERKK